MLEGLNDEHKWPRLKSEPHAGDMTVKMGKNGVPVVYTLTEDDVRRIKAGLQQR